MRMIDADALQELCKGKLIPSNFICAIRKNAQPIPLTLKECEFKKVKRV